MCWQEHPQEVSIERLVSRHHDFPTVGFNQLLTFLFKPPAVPFLLQREAA